VKFPWGWYSGKDRKLTHNFHVASVSGSKSRNLGVSIDYESKEALISSWRIKKGQLSRIKLYNKKLLFY